MHLPDDLTIITPMVEHTPFPPQPGRDGRRTGCHTWGGPSLKLALTAMVLAAAVPLCARWLSGWSAYHGEAVIRAVVEAEGQVLLTTGPRAGERLPVPAVRLPGGELPAPGRQILLNVGDDDSLRLVGHGREFELLTLLAIFIWVVLAAGGRHGWRALLTMGLALAGPLAIAPYLLRGWPPVILTGVLGLVLLAVMIRVNVPVRAARPAALAGAAAGLLATIVLARLAVHTLRLSGVHDWSTRGLWQQPAGRGLDFPGILVAGLIICALGVVMDLATAVSLSIHEVAALDPHLDRRQLRNVGMRIGRDVIGTELNSLIFAFAGANIGLLLLPVLGSRVTGFEVPALHTISTPAAAIGTAETLLATIGLVLTIPFTAWIAAGFAGAGVPAPSRPAPPSVPPLPLDPAAAGWRPRRTAGALLILLLLWLVAAHTLARSSHRYAVHPLRPSATERHLVQARVISADRLPEDILSAEGGLRAEAEQRLVCRLISGPRPGLVTEVVNPFSGQPGNDRPVRPRDRVLLELRQLPDDNHYVTLIEIERAQPLLALLALLLAAVLLTGQNRGVRAILALALSALVVQGCVLLTGVHGWPAIPVFAVGAIPLSALVFLVLAGPTRKALIAGLGSLAAVLTGGLAALICAWWMGFSGLHAGDLMALRLFAGAGNLDFRGLYVAGVLLGAIGVAMDVAIAVASAATEIRAAAPAAPRAAVHARALLIGRSVMAPMTLTLLCAYLGMNLPLLILPWAGTGVPTAVFLNRDAVSAEIVRILAGSLAVAAAVPLTAGIAAWLLPPRTTRD